MYARSLLMAAALFLVFTGAAAAYPPSGDDSQQMSATATVLIYELGPSCDVTVIGSGVVHRSNEYDPGDGRQKIDTEITSMSLTGSCSGLGPINVSRNTSLTSPSTGAVQQQVAGQDFTADAFFDVFFTVYIPELDMTLEAILPTHIESQINELPLNAAFLPPTIQTVPLVDPSSPSTPVGELTILQMDFSPEIPIPADFAQVDWFGNSAPRIENSDWGEATFHVLDPPAEMTYINVVAQDVFGDPQWIVMNLPVLPADVAPAPQDYKSNFDLSKLGYTTGTDVPSLQVGMIQSTTIFDTPPAVDFVTVILGTVVFDYEGRPGGPHRNLHGSFLPDDPLYWLLPFPLRYMVRQNTPNVECDLQECGPAAAANSFAWMADEYGYDTLPGLGTLLDSLKNPQHMNTNSSPADSGTYDDNFLGGKLKLINEYDLPVEVHFQGGLGLNNQDYMTDDGTAHAQGAKPTFEWIEKQMDMGQDVELGLTWFDSLGAPAGGHWITLQGKVDYGVGAPRGFYYRQDKEQGDNDSGTVGSDFSWLTLNDDSLLVLANEPANQIDFAVAESPTNEGFLPGDADSNGIVNISDAVFLIAYIFGGGAAPEPIELGDADANGIVNISDAVYLIAYIFGGGAAPGACDEGSIRIGPFCVNNNTGANKSGVTVTLTGTGGTLSKPIVTVKSPGCGAATVSAISNTVTITFDDACVPPNGVVCFTVCCEHKEVDIAGATWF